MDKLIEALTIFLKYGNPEYPTHCEHDVMYVCYSSKDKDRMSQEDLDKLDILGFFYCDISCSFKSYQFGSA